VEDQVLLNKQTENLRTQQQYTRGLELGVSRGALWQSDLLFLKQLWNAESISHSQEEEIGKIKARAGQYATVIDAYVGSYHEYLNIVEQRSVAMARNIRAYGKSMVFPVGDFHFNAVIKGLESMKGASRKPTSGQSDQSPAMNGGIDLTKASTPLDVHNEGGVINFNINPALIEQIIKAPGLTPHVFAIDPLQSLPEFLGMSKEEAQQMAA
jgi:hypothetical protein